MQKPSALLLGTALKRMKHQWIVQKCICQHPRGGPDFVSTISAI
jgi:hypothetical protein